MIAQFSNNPLVWPVWLQVMLGSVAAAELVAIAAVAWMFTPARCARRVRVTLAQGRYDWNVRKRHARQAEDRYWADMDLRGREVLHARALAADRTRTEHQVPAALLKAVH